MSTVGYSVLIRLTVFFFEGNGCEEATFGGTGTNQFDASRRKIQVSLFSSFTADKRCWFDKLIAYITTYEHTSLF